MGLLGSDGGQRQCLPPHRPQRLQSRVLRHRGGGCRGRTGSVLTTYGHDTTAESYKSIIFLAGEDVAEVKDGKLTVKGEGEITYVLTYEGKVSGAVVTYYTQPVTLSAKAETPTDTTESSTDEATEPTTDPAHDTDTPTEGDGTTSDSETEAPKGGCKSALGSIALLMIAGAALVLGKKKD